MILKLFSVVLVSLHLVGCASNAAIVDPNAMPEPVSWLQDFNDPDLNAVVGSAQLHNPTMQRVAQTVERAQWLSKQNKAELMKEVAYDSVNTSIGYYLSGRSIKSIEWESILWNKINSAEPTADITSQTFSQHALTAQVVKNYARVIDAKLQIDNVEQQLAAQKKLVDIVSADSAVAVNDIVSQRNKLTSLESQLVTIRKSANFSAQAIEALTGNRLQDVVGNAAALPDIPAPLPADISSSVLERRPDIIAARQRITNSFQDDGDVASLPLLDLTSELGGSSSSLLSLLNPTDWAWKAVTGLVGIFFRDKSKDAISTAAQEQALLDYGQVVYAAFKEVEGYLDEGEKLQSEKKILQKSYQQSNDDYQIAELRYDRQEIAANELLLKQRQKLQVQSELWTIQRALIEQRVNLTLAMGGDV